jgi:hypothetical protein
MNGQHLRNLPEEELLARIGAALVDAGVLSSASSPFAAAVAALVKGSVEVLTDAAAQVPGLLAYPLEEVMASEECKAVRCFWGGAHLAGCKARSRSRDTPGWVEQRNTTAHPPHHPTQPPTNPTPPPYYD